MSDVKFSVSDAAIKRIDEMLKDEPSNSIFRVCVNGGGCSGFQYEFKIDTEVSDTDIKVTDKVMVDDLSITFLSESTLDFHEDLGGSHFLVKNPNATAKCGCGNSFSM